MMDDVLDEIVRVARRCESAAQTFQDEPLHSMIERLRSVSEEVGKAWSGSNLGYHAGVYVNGLRPQRPGEHFDSEWGAQHAFSNRTSGDWGEYSYEAVEAAILERAGIEDLDVISQAAKACGEVFDDAKSEMLPTFDAVLASHDDAVLRDLREKLEELPSHFSRHDFQRATLPQGQVMTRDYLAMQQGFRAAHHVCFQSWLVEQQSYALQLGELAKKIRYAEKYMKKKLKMKGQTVANTDGRVFIGHGHSEAWRDLKDFIQDRLKLPWDEFNRESTAGLSGKERLEAMLDAASFAFLVMTAEDEHADSTKHARENVIHEAGLFQGRLGFRRAIILLEHGCAEFSNVAGIQQIRFSRGNIREVYEEIRRVLEREGILK
jgi:predicted nucleotide-binding protein